MIKIVIMDCNAGAWDTEAGAINWALPTVVLIGIEDA
jgi:hypothetical protein